MDEGSLSSDSDSDLDLLMKPLIKYEPRPPEGSNMALELRNAFRRHDKKVLLVDIGNKIQWTGGELLERASQVASGLVKEVGVKPNDVIMTICNHSDMEILLALGIVFSGAAIYGTTSTDGYTENKVLCELVKPNVLVIQSDLHSRALTLRQDVPGMAKTKIIWLDNPIASMTPIRRNLINVNGSSKQNNQQNLLLIAARNRRRLSNFVLDDNDNNNDDSTTDFQAEHERLIELKHIIDRDGVILFDDLVNGPVDEHLVESIARDSIKPSDHVLSYMLTSGSTGRPKVVPSTHEELVHGLYSMISACLNPVQERGVRRGSITSCAQKIGNLENGANIGKDGYKVLNGYHNAHLLEKNSLADDNNNNNSSSNHNHSHGGYVTQTGTNIRCRKPLMPFGPNAVVSGDLPLDHGAGLNTMFLALWLGGKYIVMPSYDVDAFWQAVSDYKITASISSTTFGYKLFQRLKLLIDSNDTTKWQLDSFKLIGCTGAKMAFYDLIQEVAKVYPHIKVSQCYGCTEIGLISMVHHDECDAYSHSAGYLLPGLVAKVVDPERTTDHPLGPEERGELLLFAKSKFKGYKCHWQDDPARIFAECHDSRGMFYRTGDQVHYDHEGRIYIHGRFKDTLTLMEEWKILPAELEQIVQEHPLVEMCAVIGVPDPQLPGFDTPKAFVKLISSSSQELEKLAQIDKLLAARCLANDREFICKDIYDFVAERTARPKHLTGGIRILDEFPRVGLLNKIDRKALKQMD